MSIPVHLLRVIALCLAVLCAGQATGVSEALAGGCTVPCDDDDDEGECPPTCGSCACSVPRIVPPLALRLPSPPAPLMPLDLLPMWSTPGAPASPVLDNLLRVPIAALA